MGIQEIGEATRLFFRAQPDGLKALYTSTLTDSLGITEDELNEGLNVILMALEEQGYEVGNFTGLKFWIGERTDTQVSRAVQQAVEFYERKQQAMLQYPELQARAAELQQEIAGSTLVAMTEAEVLAYAETAHPTKQLLDTAIQELDKAQVLVANLEQAWGAIDEDARREWARVELGAVSLAEKEQEYAHIEQELALLQETFGLGGS